MNDPRPHALYRHFDADRDLLYVGISVDPDQRALEHRTSTWWPDVDHITVEWHPDEVAARIAEGIAIDTEHPVWNVVRTRISGRTVPQLRSELTADDEAELHRLFMGARPPTRYQAANLLGVKPDLVAPIAKRCSARRDMYKRLRRAP